MPLLVIINSFIHYNKRNSNLPYFDLIRLTLPKPGALPVATVVEMQKSLNQEVYAEFDYFYFTEADQMLVMRSPQHVFQQLNDNEMFTVVPHRLVPYAKEVHDIVFDRVARGNKPFSKKKQKKNSKQKKDKKSDAKEVVTSTTTSQKLPKKQTISMPDNHFGWLSHSCCMPRQNCLERDNWVPLLNENLPYMNIYGLHVALGNSNFHKLAYRPCTMLDKAVVEHNYCP
jgi:hypothetical protein